MTPDYESFLICFHPNNTEIYRCGQPIGAIKDGKFEAHKKTLPSGEKEEVKLPYETLERVQLVLTTTLKLWSDE